MMAGLRQHYALCATFKGFDMRTSKLLLAILFILPALASGCSQGAAPAATPPGPAVTQPSQPNNAAQAQGLMAPTATPASGPEVAQPVLVRSVGNFHGHGDGPIRYGPPDGHRKLL